MTSPLRSAVLLSCAAALAGCADAQLDPFGRPYSGDYNYPAGHKVCTDPSVEVQPEFIRGNHPAMPVENAFEARNAVATVKFKVTATGTVQILSADSSDKGYGNHAVIAVRDWKFKPALRGGVPVDAQCEVRFGSYFRRFEDLPPGQANQ